MGLVAWVERPEGQASSGHGDGAPAIPGSGSTDAGTTDPAATTFGPAAPGSSSDPAPAVAPATPPALPMPMPREPSVLATWLPSQPLAPFTYRERTLTRVGREDAPLLVVVERGVPAEGLPLVDEAAELFERMLRAVGLARRDTRQCVLSAEPAPADADTVGAFALAPYRAALVLMQELDGELDGAACRFPLGEGAAAHPAWCVPHPDRLLLEPPRKAQAWQALKGLRRHLESAA